MGTVVRAGSGTGVVVATGARAEFGRIALGLGERQPETDFQAGLRHFSVLLLQVAVALTTLILVANLVLHRPIIQSLLFSLAIAVGITPQLLPAVVSTSLATGSRQLAKRKVLVERLVCIEDLGDMDVLVTDKTGTLTEGRITFTAALDPAGADCAQVLRLGLLSTETDPAGGAADAVGGNPLDAALWEAAPREAAAKDSVTGYVRIRLLPFDHDRRMTSAVVRAPGGDRQLVVKGAPESVLPRCTAVPPVVGVVLPLSPLSHLLGFAHLPVGFFLALAGMVIGYLVLIELAKRLFFAGPEGRLPRPHQRRRGRRHRLQRRAARFSVGARLAH